MSRLLVFLYGVIVYAIFFPTFMYLFGFIGGYFVPKTVDSGEPGPLWQALLINTGLVALFGVQHAIMARPAFKRWWTRIIPAAAERSTFVLIATALIALICWQWRPMPTVLWDIDLPLARALLHGQFVLGVLLVLGSSFLIDHFDLFGLRQVWLHLRNQPYTHHPFVERSLYKAMRHLLMLGFLITIWTTPTMTLGHALFAGLFTAYIVIGTRMEERDLVAFHGPQYQDYCRRTPMLFPFKKRPRRSNAGATASAAS